jgi:uncharacterized protein (DUF433 family)
VARRIVSDPEILGGKPVIEGTRLSVEHILGLMSHGMSHAEIIEDYPILTKEDVNLALRYAVKAIQNDILIEVKRS